MKSLYASFTVLALVIAGGSLASAAAPGKGGGGNSAGNSNTNTPSTPQSPGQSASGASGSTASFESVMFAYGALDEMMAALARRACVAVPDPAAGVTPLIIVVDQNSLLNLQAYDSFYHTEQSLENAFQKMAPAIAKPALAGDTFADITSAVATVLVASNVDSASTITIQDASAAIKLSAYLNEDQKCKGKMAEIVYPDVFSGDLAGFDTILQNLAAVRSSAIAAITPTAVTTSVGGTAFTNLDATYNQFLASTFATNSTTGQSGFAPIIQGYGLRKLLNTTGRPIYEVYVNVAAAGGTERVRKNALTALTIGDWITYSGGAIVNAMIFEEKPTPAVLFSDVLRYRSPLTHNVHDPIRKHSTDRGDNLSDTCLTTGDSCAQELKKALSNEP